MKKKFNASSVVLLILFVISAVVLVMFYGVGFGAQDTINNNVYTAPQNTGLLLIWLYALVAICAGAVFVFSIFNGIKNSRGKVKGEARKSWVGPVFLATIVVIVVAYFLANTTPVRLGDNSLFEDATLLKLVDVCIYTIYALVLGSILCTVLSMIGVFKKK